MISEDGIVYFLEINTLPGLTTTSLFPKVLPVPDMISPDCHKNFSRVP